MNGVKATSVYSRKRAGMRVLERYSEERIEPLPSLLESLMKTYNWNMGVPLHMLERRSAWQIRWSRSKTATHISIQATGS